MGSQRGARTPAVDHTGSQKRGPRITRNLKRRPVLYVILALMVLLFLSSMATGFDLAVKLNYILVLLLIVSWLWSSAGANQLDAEVRRPTGPFSVGDTVSERITVFNRGRTPKAWVEVEDQTNLPGVVFRHVTPLGIMVPFANASSEATLTKRGEFVIGPLVVRVADPFTLFPREIQFAGVEKMLVYPQVIPLPDFAAPNPYLVGEHSRRQRANMVSTDVSSVRDYVAGDSIGRIHWLSTARTGNLMVKQFDQGSSSHLWVVFDQFHGAQAGEGEDSTDEYGATLAASVVDRYSRGFLPVGYTGHGSESLVAAPDQSEAHRENVMRHIAASLPTGNIPLFEVLGDLERDFSQATSLVIITAAGDGEWVEALVGLQRRGVKVSVVVMDSASFGGADNSIAVERLVGSGIRTFRVHHGDSISGALSAPVGLVDTVDHVGSQEGGLLGSSTAPVPATTYSEMAPTAPIRPPTNNMASPEVVD
jgi:uncharacterized protein (DUF58 family)